jgi:superoxide dismutase, Cu-Zn family
MYRFVCLIAAGVFLAACNDGVSPGPVERQWQATLEGIDDWEHLSGLSVVEFTEGTGSFAASAEIEGDEPGAVRPWHVHFSTCAEGGGIVGVDGDYPRLEVGADGTASASATVPQPLQVGASYHVNVHLSEAEMATIIACGDLVLTN